MNYRGINHDFAQQGRIYYFTLFVSRLGLAACCLVLARMGTAKSTNCNCIKDVLIL